MTVANDIPILAKSWLFCGEKRGDCNHFFLSFFPTDLRICYACVFQFGTWSYDGFKINLIPLRGYVDDNITISNGIDLSEYYLSIEWDIMAVKNDLIHKLWSNVSSFMVAGRSRQ